MNTPKALANWSPGFEHRENPGNFTGNPSNPERVRQLANAFSVPVLFQSRTQGCRYAPTAGLKLANAFGVTQTEALLIASVVTDKQVACALLIDLQAVATTPLCFPQDR